MGQSMVMLWGCVGVVGGSLRLPDGEFAEAFAVFDCLVPEEFDWPAEEDGEAGCNARPGKDQSYETEAEDAEKAIRKDAQVLYEDRNLCQEKPDTVYLNRSPEWFHGSGEVGL